MAVTGVSLDWQQLYRQRQDVADRFGEIWSVPVDTRYHRVLSRAGAAGVQLLEVGAGDGPPPWPGGRPT